MAETPWPSGDMLAELESLRRRAKEFDDLRTEFHLLTESLADLERRYSALYDGGPLLCAVVRPDGTLRDVNHAAESLLAVPRDRIIGRRLHEFVVQGADTDAAENVERACSGKLASEFETDVRTGNGSTRRLLFHSAIPLLDAHGESDGVLLVAADVTDWRRAESALRDGDRPYESLLNGLPAPVCSFDTGLTFVFANWAAADVFEIRPRDLVGRGLKEFVIEEDWALVLDRTSELGEGRARPYDLNIIRPDGTTRAVSVHHALRHDKDGRPIGVVAVLQAATEHRTVARALEESEARYRSLFEESIDVIYITSRDGRLIDISPSAVTLFGYTREELLERDVHGLYVDPEQRVRFQETIEQQGFVRGFEVTLRNRDGREVNCLLTSTVRKSADGRTLGYQGIMRDVTAQKRAEAARDRERRAFRAIAEAAAMATDVADLCSRILNGLVTVLGFDGGTLRIHDRKTGLLHPVATAGLRDRDVALIQDQNIESERKCTAAHVARTGEPIFAPDVSSHSIVDTHGERVSEMGVRSLISYPVFGSQRNLIAVIQLFARAPHDMREEEDRLFFSTVAGMLGAVIERKIAEEEKHEVEAQLLQAQKMEAVGTLASGVAHDFNNLLTAIQGFAELAMMSVDESDGVHADLEKIRAAADRGAGLVRQLLLFGREQPVQLHPVDINSATLGIVKMLDPLIGADIRMHTVLEPDLWQAIADEGSIQQVIMNLAVNARDAMPEGGTLTIRTRNVTLDEVTPADGPDARPGSFVCISVEDSGAGMDEETLGRIFEPFFSTKGPGKGTGLGLSVVYGIVRQHGGWIYTLSTPRMGTTFEIYIPAAENAESAAQREAAPGADTTCEGRGERILVVEDEETVRELAATILRKNGYEVFEAASAAQALDIFRREEGRFDLVFSDVVLPDRSGVQLVDELLTGFPKMRVLMSSGHASHRSQWETIAAKGLPFLQKPYSLPGLLRMVRETIHSA